jgi:hypothetical protein
MFYFFFAFRCFFFQVLCHNLCFLMYSKLFLVVVGLLERWLEQGCCLLPCGRKLNP